MPPPTSAINISDPRPTSPLRRVSTHTSASDKYDPSVASRNRFSRDCSFIEDALQEGDTFGPGLSLQDEPVHLVELPAPPYHVPDQPAQHFKVIRKLGAGSYAVVYLVRELLDVKENRLGREYAVKCLSKVGLDAEALQAQMLEATIQQALPPHPNVATLYRTLQTQSYLLLIQEYVPGEDLFYFLEQARDHEDFDNQSFGTPPTPSLLASLHPSQLLSDRRLRLIASMFSQMCEAVASCHRAQVFHRDIKPENFIVTDGQIPGASGDYERHVVVKLTDFGLATRDVESSDVDCGSAPYMSYECRNNIAPTYTTAPADVWSLGVVLLNMLYHHNPWGDTNRGACQSFTFYLQDPIAFFMQRFPGMTPAVAQFFAQRVFCILDPSKPPRITAHEFGLWARNLPRHLGAQSRRNPNIAFQMAAAASSATPTPAPRSRPTGDILGIHDATTGASYRDKAPPPLSTLPPVQQPVFSTGDLSDGESDYDDAASAGAKSRSRDGKRRKRAARGKGSNNASAIQTPTTANGTPLYTPDDDNLAQLASATQSRAREISNAIAHSRGTSIATSLSNPSFQSTTTVNTVSTTTTTTTTTQVIKKKKSSKWGDIFRRDSGSDQEFVSDYLNSTSVGDNRMAANIHDSLSSSSVLPAPAPSARAQQVTNIILGLNPQMPSEAPPKAKVTAQDGSVRGRKKNKVMDDADSRRRAPSAPASADRSWRDKSTERIHHTHLPANYPPVPELPPHYRQTNAAPSNVSVSTTTSSSVLTTPHARSTSFLHQSPQSPPTSSVVSNPWDGPYAPKSAAPSIRSMAPSVMSTSTYSSSASSNWRSSASSKYAGSVRSVSTAATSVSSGSNWRERGTRQTNIKQMDGVPWELDEMPRQMSHRPKEHKFKPPPPSANPSDSKRRAGISSSKPGSGGVPPLPPLDTINERYKGGGGTGFSPVNESPVESIGALEGAPKSAGASKSKLWPRWGRK